ncbi:MAG: SAM-dependent methyltransferase [Acetobacteraceae bacterium]|nr:SAM-dependent methyltransferase [Acetobacteraceae bacterium]
MRLDRFMAACNAHYYATRDPFGRGGDFITAPEIFQGFGECLGLWAAAVWQDMGRPETVLLAELGPGRGTLMADALRAIRRAAPGFAACLSVHFIETSPRLRAAQRARVPGARFHDAPEALPALPAIVIANEFLDALPVRQLVRREGGWAERFLDASLAPVELPAPPPAETPDLAALAPATWIELAPAAGALAASVAQRTLAHGGAALLIDYGYAGPGTGTTLQALRGHRAQDPFADPGEADLSAHVDFGAIGRIARAAGATPHGPVPMGTFLGAIGLPARAEALARANPARAGALLAAAARLLSAAHMGTLFKAMAICHPSLPRPPGFA